MTIVKGKRVQFIALFWMLAGSAIVLLALVFMNHFSDQPEAAGHEYQASFEVKQVKKVEKKKEKIKKTVRQKQRIAPPLMLDMDSGIAGIDLGLPGFSINDMAAGELLGDTSNVVMTGDMVDSVPRALTRTAVEYPRRAKAKDIEGYVVISLLIDKSGRVSNARVIESEPAGVFEEKALQTVRTWLFEPARYKGRAVDSWANQTIRFELS